MHLSTPPATPSSSRQLSAPYLTPQTPSPTSSSSPSNFVTPNLKIPPPNAPPSFLSTPPPTPPEFQPSALVTPIAHETISTQLHAVPEEKRAQLSNCLQCRLLSLPCDGRRPSCSRCLRRNQVFGCGRGRHGQDIVPCLVEEVGCEGGMGSGGVYGSVLVRLEGDGQEVWEGKVRAWEELLSREKAKREKGNWILPTPRFYKTWNKEDHANDIDKGGVQQGSEDVQQDMGLYAHFPKTRDPVVWTYRLRCGLLAKKY